MIVVFSEQHKADLAFLASQDVAILNEFAKIAIDFIKRGMSGPQDRKKFAVAAKKLNLPAKAVEGAVQALSYLFCEATKLQLREKDFIDSLLTLAYPDEHNQALKEVWLANKNEIRTLLGDMLMDLPHFSNLDWRLDIQLASRSARNLLNPLFLLNLETQDGEKKTQITLQTDYPNLKHITAELEIALDTMKQVYARRVSRNVNI